VAPEGSHAREERTVATDRNFSAFHGGLIKVWKQTNVLAGVSKTEFFFLFSERFGM